MQPISTGAVLIMPHLCLFYALSYVYAKLVANKTFLVAKETNFIYCSRRYKIILSVFGRQAPGLSPGCGAVIMDNIGKLNGALYRHMQAELNTKLGHLGLGSGQSTFFFYICRYEGLSQKELTEKIFLEKSTTAKAVKYLEANGFIRREQDKKDKRVERLYLTEKGKSLQHIVSDAFEANLGIAMRGLTDKEQSTLLKLLNRALANFAEHRGQAERLPKTAH